MQQEKKMSRLALRAIENRLLEAALSRIESYTVLSIDFSVSLVNLLLWVSSPREQFSWTAEVIESEGFKKRKI